MCRVLFSLLVSTILLPVPQPKVTEEDVAGKQAEEIIREAIKAHGGEEALKKRACFVLQSKGWQFLDGERIPLMEQTWGDRKQYKSITCYQPSGEKYTVVTIDDKGQVWQSVNGKKSELTKADLEELNEMNYCGELVSLVSLIKDALFKISALPDTEFNEKKVSCVKVSSKGHIDVNLFFDKSNGLLLKWEGTGFRGGKTKKEKMYADYRKVDGLMFPMKCTMLLDGKPFRDAEIVEIKFPKNIDAVVFKVPINHQD